MTYVIMRWPWERRQEMARSSLVEVVHRLEENVAVLRVEVERLRIERDGNGEGRAGGTPQVGR